MYSLVIRHEFVNKELYEKAAKAAYANCLDLLHEANLLYEHEKYARAFVLGALSCEEFAKSFLYKCVACELLTENQVKRHLGRHELKLIHFTFLIISKYGQLRVSDAITKTRNHDKEVRDHSKHIFPKELDKIDADVNKLIDLLNMTNDLKFKSIYVDVQNNELWSPKDIMNKEMCHVLIHFINHYLYGFDVVLKQDKTTFRNTVESLHPDILSGKIKFSEK